MKDFDYSYIHRSKNKAFRRVLRFLLNLLYRVEVTGLENVPPDKGFILASNHVSAIDPVVISSQLKRMPFFMAKRELFEKPILGWILIKMNSFPIKRGKPDMAAMGYSLNIVKSGEILGIFPEGTRSKDGSPKSARSGVAFIARETEADILPVSLRVNGSKPKLFSKIKVSFGELIKFEELGINKDSSSQELKNSANIVMDRIKELWENSK
ncbi:MAG: 1-acyl-sn-glycerol-3-phosphate acyltransferase [Clostridiales bacterium]|nr:1-acyl-sn-glycerol-3-phosphate acyltransferase [Clostridiales bacterium]